MFFGYRLVLGGPPTCFKSLEKPRNTTTHTVDDPNYPYRQVREITTEEYALKLNELKAKYPFVPEAGSGKN